MTIATELRNTVLMLLGDFGRSMTLRKIAAGAYNDADGTSAAATTTDYTGIGRLGSYSDRAIDGTIIQVGDRRCTLVLDNNAIIPDINDILIVGGVNYAVVNFKRIEVADETVVFSLQVRRG